MMSESQAAHSWAILVGWLTVWRFFSWLTTHFVITDRRVMFRHGLLTRSGIEPEYLELVAPDTLQPVSSLNGEVLAVVAALGLSLP